MNSKWNLDPISIPTNSFSELFDGHVVNDSENKVLEAYDDEGKLRARIGYGLGDGMSSEILSASITSASITRK